MKSRLAYALAFNAETKTIQLDIYDSIGDAEWAGEISSRQVLEQVTATKDAETIQVRLNSAGGMVFEGLAIYNLLANHKARVEVTIDGLAASIASVVAMAGDTITMAENAMMMIHNPYALAVGDSDDLRQTAEALDKMRDSLAVSYAARSGNTITQIREWMDAETWMTAQEAKSRGFATHVTPAKRMAAQAWNFSGFMNIPESLRGFAATERTTPALSGTKEAIAMDPKEAIAKLETDLTASLARCKAAEERTKDAEIALAESATALKAKTLECESNVNAFADLKAKYQTLEAAAIKAELDTLVGKKITPAQVEQFTDLRASIGPDKFKALVDGLPDLVLGKAVVSPDPKPKSNMSEAGSRLAASLNAEAGAGR